MKYKTVNGKSYRKCGYCEHFRRENLKKDNPYFTDGECNLFHAKCKNDNGCTEEIILKKEKNDI